MISLNIAFFSIFILNSAVLVSSCDINQCQTYRQESEQSFKAGKLVFCRAMEKYMVCLRRLSVDCIHNNHVKQVLSRYSTSCLEPKIAYFEQNKDKVEQSKDKVETKTDDLYDDIEEKNKKLKKTDDLNVERKKNKNDDLYDDVGEKLGKEKEKRTNMKKSEDKDDMFDDFGEKPKDDRRQAIGDKRIRESSRNRQDDINDDEQSRSYASRFNAYGARWNNDNPTSDRQQYSSRFGSKTTPSVSHDNDDDSDDDNENDNDMSDQDSDEITSRDQSYKPSFVPGQFVNRNKNNGRYFLINNPGFYSEERDVDLDDINLPLFHNPNQGPHFVQHPGFLQNMVVRSDYFEDTFDGLEDVYDENMLGMDDLEDYIPTNFNRGTFDDFDDDMLKQQPMIRNDNYGHGTNVKSRNDVDSSSEEDWPKLANDKLENQDSNEFFGDGSFEDDDRKISYNFKSNNTKRILSSSLERSSGHDTESNENTLITGHSLQTLRNERRIPLEQYPPHQKHLDIDRQPKSNFPAGLQFMSDNIPLSQKMGIQIDKKPDQMFMQRSEGFSPLVRREQIFKKGEISEISNVKNSNWLFSDNTLETEAVRSGNTSRNRLLKQTLKEDGGRLFKPRLTADDTMFKQNGTADSNSVLNTQTIKAESNNLLQNTPTSNKVKMIKQTMAEVGRRIAQNPTTDISTLLKQNPKVDNSNKFKQTMAEAGSKMVKQNPSTDSNTLLKQTPTKDNNNKIKQTLATASSSVFKLGMTDDSSILKQQTIAENNSNNILKPTIASVVCLISLMFI